MGYIENDPRDTAYIALYIAIKWYQEISSETALRIAQGKSYAKPGQKLTPELYRRIKKIIQSPNFTNINSVVRKYRVNKYDVLKAYAEEQGIENANEEVILVSQIETLLKRLKSKAESCNASNCEKCNLNQIVFDETTLCEMLCDIEFDSKGRLVNVGNRQVQKTAFFCSDEYLTGDVRSKGFEVYTKVLEEFTKFTRQNSDKKIRDIVSAALLEYVERHGDRAKNKAGH